MHRVVRQDNRAIEEATNARNTAGRNDTGIANHTDFTVNHDLITVLVAVNEVRVFTQGSDTIRVYKHDHVNNAFRLKQTDSINDVFVFNRIISVKHVAGIQQFNMSILIQLTKNGISHGCGCLTNRITVCRKHRNIGNFSTDTSHFHLIISTFSTKGTNRNFIAFSDFFSFAVPNKTGNRNGAASTTSQGSVKGRIRKYRDCLFNFSLNHITNDFRVNKFIQSSKFSVRHLSS